MAAARKMKGRGAMEDDRYEGRGGVFESIDDDDQAGPARSIEGWVLVLAGVHEEAQEDDLLEAFADFGEVRNLHLNLDRRTGFVKGYAFVEYSSQKEAIEAQRQMNGAALLGQKLVVDWAFTKASGGKRRRR